MREYDHLPLSLSLFFFSPLVFSQQAYSCKCRESKLSLRYRRRLDYRKRINIATTESLIIVQINLHRWLLQFSHMTK